MPGPKTQVPALDGVRGVAILLVMLYHMNLLNPPRGGVEQAWTAVMNVGWSGVDLFFVLSGFLITGILLDQRERRPATFFGHFYARRVLRIFPLYYLFLVATFFALPPLVRYLGPGGQRLLGFGEETFWYWLYLPNVLFAKDGFVPSLHLNATWSLGVEEQFYLVWPLLVYVFPRRGLPWLFGGLVVLALVSRLAMAEAGVSWVAIFVLPWGRLDTLALGSLLAWWARQPKGLPGWLRPLARGGVVLGVVVAGAILARGERIEQFVPGVYTWGLTAIAFFYACVLLLGVVEPEGSPVRRLLESRSLRTFGKYAYGAYLLHVPLYRVVVREIVDVATDRGYLHSRLGTQIFASLCGLWVTLVAAFVLFHLFEEPFLRLKRRFA